MSLERDKDSAIQTIDDLYSTCEGYREEVSAKEIEIDNLNMLIDSKDDEIDNLREEIASLKTEINLLKHQ